jgi:hypothetical protein
MCSLSAIVFCGLSLLLAPSPTFISEPPLHALLACPSAAATAVISNRFIDKHALARGSNDDVVVEGTTTARRQLQRRSTDERLQMHGRPRATRLQRVHHVVVEVPATRTSHTAQPHAAAHSHAVLAKRVHPLAPHGVTVGLGQEHHAVARCKVHDLRKRQRPTSHCCTVRLPTCSKNDGSLSGGGGGCFFAGAALATTACVGRPAASLPTCCHMPVEDTAGAGASAAVRSML